MPLTSQDPDGQAPRRPARDLIEAVLENMRRNLEPLKYSTLAPSRYLVYLHPDEFKRLEGILPILQDQTMRALGEEIAKLNKPGFFRRASKVENPAVDWYVEFLADPDGDLESGDILIDSELLLPALPELGVGERTRRITTVHSGKRTTTREHGVETPRSEGLAFARLVYEDNAGHHSHDVVKDSVTIGRGGIAYPVDVRIVSSVDVSREHARIRREPNTGSFFLIDLSSLGTTLDGRHVPRGYDDVEGSKRENGAETLLPDRARIGLADTVYLDFQKVRG